MTEQIPLAKPSTSDIRSGSGQGVRPTVGTTIRCLHGLVTYGPWDLEIASAMSAHGYNAVKWAEGQGLLAELVSCDAPAGTTLAVAMAWYDEAASTARRALAAQPRLLAKLGLNGDSQRHAA